MRSTCGVLAGLCLVATAQATDLNLRLESGTTTSVRVSPGTVVPYSIRGELSDASSAGLAMFALDLSFGGGPLTRLSSPASAPMTSFASPLGFTNPAGFGGVISAGNVLQVGGAQNTIRNTLAPTPSGLVVSNVAQLGSSQVLANGVVTAPYQVGTFTLSASNVQANVIRSGQTGLPFWTVDAAGVGSVTHLVVQVVSLRGTAQTIHVGAAEHLELNLHAGPANAGRGFRMLGSTHGTAPGVTLPGGLTLPLNPDRYYQYTNTTPNSAILSNSQGTLDAEGRATVIFTPNARFEGQTVHHAFYLTGPINFVSEAEAVLVVH